ncbi:anhydro-N-acetylmuramic acid kinase [Gaetbulibacter aquiaggeris]|uniref:Anhydro-N-acetylmuramic acid kinase n=1 Tax=Gaetbulibacter aquiaggeris TaxID=1735373 RepID=A0ABW7MTA5_9FLAO
MIKSQYKVIGVMSGTSLDGIDLVYTTFNFGTKWSFQILYAETLAYSAYWNTTLKDLVLLSEIELRQIDEDYTRYLASKIKDFIVRYNINDIDAICTHGHTALHQPHKKMTYQIGNLPILASLLEQTIVCDFRVQDVELGGQGAPLVPIGDALLFCQYEFCLNLGGFANISYEMDNQRIAYDICPVNIVLNYYVKQLGYDFDDGGRIALTGKTNNDLLEQLNNLDYYKKTFPKSLGLEWVKSVIIPLIDSFNLEFKDILRTFIEHIALQISKEINKRTHVSALVTGGGVYNDFLMSRIKTFSKNTIMIPSKEIIEFKEALIFGFLGVLKLRGENNCLQSVTGARHDHSSGNIFHE